MNTKILEQLEETFAQEIALAGNDLGSSEMLVQEKLQAERRQSESARPVFLLLFNLLRRSQDLR